MSAARLSLRTTTAPLTRDRAADSAFCSAAMAAATSTSVGDGAGKCGLFDMAVTTLCAYVTSAGTGRGRLRMTMLRLTDVFWAKGNSRVCGTRGPG
jgi:hypothetical protein